MKKLISILFLIVLAWMPTRVKAIEIERFELLNTNDGLSQNSVQSIFCDSRGFMWFGTMDGLNRYDGYNFKVYKSKYNDPYSLTNNRIVSIWEDRRGFIWLASHDGHYHYMDVRKERFYSFPPTTEPGNPRNTRVTSFLEKENEIWIGTNNAGIYRLTAPADSTEIYDYVQIEGTELSDSGTPKINFIAGADTPCVWVGTNVGLQCFSNSNSSKSGVARTKWWKPELNFTHGLLVDQTMYLATAAHGLMRLDVPSGELSSMDIAGLDGQISLLQMSKSGQLLVGTEHQGLFICEKTGQVLRRYLTESAIESVFEDSYGFFWISTDDFGITRVGPELGDPRFYELVPKEVQSLVDLQRQFLFEDRDGNLWFATHGGGLGLYNRETEKIRFYRNDPNSASSLSSDIAYCVAQDQSGLLWVGTGQLNAGINKVIPANPMFEQFKVEENIKSLADNVIRALNQDDRDNIWMASKSGRLYVYNPQFELLQRYDGIPTNQGTLRRFNVYSIFQDKQGYLWLGSKGGGLARSQLPLKNYRRYSDVSFNLYRHQPQVNGSLSNDNVYCITQDREGRILIGTYGSGIDVVENPSAQRLRFRNINTENSSLSSNEVRYILEDLGGNIWVATTFGLNELEGSIDASSPRFNSYFYDVNYDRSLSYNDLIYLYMDSAHRMWLGTFGGGLNRIMQDTDDDIIFSHESKEAGLISDAVFGILEGESGDLWLSTEDGISRYDIQSREFENYDKNNGLLCSNFSEGTCLKLKDGRLVFGTLDGVLIVNETDVRSHSFEPPVAFTSFSLFNDEVDYRTKGSPLKQHINFTREIELKYNQSSFSIEYAALSYFDPQKSNYSYTLEGFDTEWYDVRNDRKASYTNLPPGSYTFKVKATNWDGTMSDEARELKITINPPWWKTRLAYLIYVLLTILIFEVSRRIFVKYNRLANDLRVERKVNEIKLKFFTNISHEIRTPLTLVLGPLEDLKRMDDLPEKLKRPVELMSTNGKRMLRLINQLLDFRKVQNQKMKLKLAEVDLLSFTRDVCHNFDQLAKQRQIDFQVPGEPQDIKVWMDPEKMDSVLFNLLSNAFKFTPNGNRIAVELEQHEKTVSVKVIDTGRGIEKRKMPMLFQRFTTLSDENNEYTGSGIGLAYSYELMKLHKGDIEVQSAAGRGSTFTVTLRLGNKHFKKDDLQELLADSSPKISHADELGLGAETVLDSEEQLAEKDRKTVLVVEDQDDIRAYLASILSPHFNVLLAEDGEKGLTIAKEKHPDLIVTDLMMPVKDGLEMTREIKDNFELSHIPVVMLTAKSAEDSQLEGIDSGAEAYVIKPFNSEYLLRVILNLLKQRQNIMDYFSKNSPSPFPAEIKVTNKDEEFLKSLVEVISQNCEDSNFNVDALVKQTSLGRTVFYNKIKTLTGMTPVEFLRNTRLQIATQYLSSGGYNVSEVAYMCGFNDLKYFSKKFKERYNCPPSQYGK